MLGVVAVTLWTGATHSEQVMPRRDSASYLQATIYLAETGSRPVAVDAETIGGPETLAEDGLTLEAPAFYEIGSPEEPQVQPQFMPGPALVYSLPWWAGGATPVLWAPAVAGGLALLAIGLLVSRVVAPAAAAPAAVLVGACFPWLHTARSTYSEPLAGLTLGAGFLALTLLAGAGEEGEGGRARALRLAALLAGGLVGGTSIVRIDALRETMLLVPVAALLLARGRGWAKPLLVGASVTTLAGFAVAGAMSWRYLGEIGGSLVPLVGLVVLMSGASWWLLRRARAGMSLPSGVARRLPDLLAGAVAFARAHADARPLPRVSGTAWRASAPGPGNSTRCPRHRAARAAPPSAHRPAGPRPAHAPARRAPRGSAPQARRARPGRPRPTPARGRTRRTSSPRSPR